VVSGKAQVRCLPTNAISATISNSICVVDCAVWVEPVPGRLPSGARVSARQTDQPFMANDTRGPADARALSLGPRPRWVELQVERAGCLQQLGACGVCQGRDHRLLALMRVAPKTSKAKGGVYLLGRWRVPAEPAIRGADAVVVRICAFSFAPRLERRHKLCGEDWNK